MQDTIEDAAAPLPPDISLKAASLKVESITAAYGTNVVLDNISIDVAPGEFFALLGPSGCGKTTLLRLIAGFSETHRGRILVDGADISRLPPWKRNVGLVFQSYALWPHMTVERNVAFGLEERRISKTEIKRRVAAALGFVGLSELAGRRPSQLSGGQQQRVALARTIAVEPKLLLLDEPLSNLDAKLRVQVRRELRLLQKRLGITSIIVTHDQEEANTICDRIAVMNEGKIQQIGSPTELYENPNNLFVAQFLGTANAFDGRVTIVDDRRVFESIGGLRLPVDPRSAYSEGAKLVLRPQHMTLDASEMADAAFRGKIVEREFLGSNVRYGIGYGDGVIWIDTPFESSGQLYEIGCDVSVRAVPDRAIFLTA